VPLGVDTSTFEGLPDREGARRELGIDGTTLVWLFVGRLNHVKGLDLLAPAFVEFCSHIRNALLVVAGPDDDGLSGPFLEECRRGGVAERIRLTGFLDRTGVRKVLAAADLWVLPSYSESFGIAVVEAMAAGLPVLITNKVNIWRTVQEARAGLVTRADGASVADGMLRLARLSSTERSSMGERGRELCRTSFSWEAAARELTTLYASIAERRQRSVTI